MIVGLPHMRKMDLERFVLAWRWPLVATMTVVSLLVEIDEHRPTFFHTVPYGFVREVVLFGLFFPGMIGIMLTLMSQVREKSVAVQRAAEAERRQIAQDLHDTLAHELGYLLLTFDRLATDPDVQDAPALRHQLEQVRSVADNAYEQLRDRLELLKAAPPLDLPSALYSHACVVGERANFQVKMRSTGEAAPLAPATRRQVLLLLGEALANVEKHAHARTVELEVTWEQDRLTVTLVDDGDGFDVASVAGLGGMGLSLMRQRAEAIGGLLTLASHPGNGTQVTLAVPAKQPA